MLTPSVSYFVNSKMGNPRQKLMTLLLSFERSAGPFMPQVEKSNLDPLWSLYLLFETCNDVNNNNENQVLIPANSWNYADLFPIEMKSLLLSTYRGNRRITYTAKHEQPVLGWWKTKNENTENCQSHKNSFSPPPPPRFVCLFAFVFAKQYQAFIHIMSKFSTKLSDITVWRKTILYTFSMLDLRRSNDGSSGERVRTWHSFLPGRRVAVKFWK